MGSNFIISNETPYKMFLREKTKEDLNRRIREACVSVTLEMLFKQSFVRRINKCLADNGYQFEHLIK